MSTESTTEVNEGLAELIRSRIENLRPKLLDLSRRNPLIATRLSPRSNSIIRVVDELPDAILSKLSGEQRMRLVALPALEEEPKDEQSRDFQDALSSGLLADEVYLSAMKELNVDDDESVEKSRQIERSLRDRIRLTLGMGARQTRGDVTLAQHARNNDISPSFDLPLPPVGKGIDRHIDHEIQCLLLPEDLERKLNSLTVKCRTWVQETGMNVLHAAFGFLEWVDPASSATVFSPLALLPVEIEKEKTKDGAQYWVKASGDDAETNLVLAEKMRLSFSIDLPKYEGGSIEQYFDEVANSAPKTIQWKVRRQVAFGIFPSARMAMYRDLDPDEKRFETNENISKLFGGSDSGGATPYADEYEVDQPAIEVKVPCLVLDADSSQFSTIVDVADGKNTAVEGPPGTGKSQTIVNTIAAAIAAGKKVLFVAEKLAALEVVRNRLGAVGLGEFVLPLQAERSAREQVISSIRDRVEMNPGAAPKDYDARIKRYRQLRAELAAYIDVIAAPFGETGFTVYDILGRCVATNAALETAPRELQSPRITNVERFDRLELEAVGGRAMAMITAWENVREAPTHWSGLRRSAIDRFVAENLAELAATAAQAFVRLAQSESDLERIGFGKEVSADYLPRALNAVEKLLVLTERSNPPLVARVYKTSQTKAFSDFLDRCQNYIEQRAKVSRTVGTVEEKGIADQLREAFDICSRAGITSLAPTAWEPIVESLDKEIEVARLTLERLRPLIKIFPELSSVPISIVKAAGSLIYGEYRDVLALRSATNADAGASVLIERFAKTGSELLAQRAELENIISVGSDLTPSELRAHAVALREGTFFRRLGGTYRAAKGAYRGFSRRTGFDRVQAARDLQQLAEWKHAEEKFRTDPQASALYGLHFRGVETDFVKFELLLRYYQAVEKSIPGFMYREVRQLLRSADIEALEAIPSFLESSFDGSFMELTARVDQLERGVAIYRAAFTRLRSLLGGLVRPSEIQPSELMKIATEVDDLSRLREALDCDVAMKAVLGDLYLGSNTEVGAFDADRQTLEILSNEPASASALLRMVEAKSLPELSTAVRSVLDASSQATKSMAALVSASQTPFDQRLAGRAASDVADYLSAASLDVQGIFTHAAYADAYADMQERGVSWAVDALLREGQPLSKLPEVLEASIFRSMAMRVYEKHGKILSNYRGDSLDRKRRELAEYDREIIKLSRQHLRLRLFKEGRPPRGNGIGRRSTWTDMALIENEISKKKAYVSVRDLTRRAGAALLELKPCWMMSPLAVAQYLPSGTLEFDLCIIDEASQMPPEDAVGALVRSKQAMVVGDTNQLPPTNFFRLMLDEDDSDEDETVLDESILEMANSAFRPARRLRWHYRSRHSGLISFSNQHVYSNNLIVFPSAHEASADMGVSLVQVRGRYHGGVNDDEAATMVEAIVQFMRDHPDRSLGVVTLNQKQRDLLLEEIDTALAQDAIAAEYVETWTTRNDGLESFFIKNLENVQGDERDVIFIGTVYGPESIGGPVMQRFGPINGLAGKRRLNVLFSRAKEQIVTFSSMTAADIRADEQGNPGAFMLKRWLEYSATGVIHAGEYSGKEPDSDFEVHVIEQLRAIGCTPVPQVGVAGYFIDIGVKHPSWPHGYIMGVECDGATYHSSRSARDRDRLREEVLGRLGWKLHRIWSTDWFNDARWQSSRLRTVIEARLAELKTKSLKSTESYASIVSGSLGA